jgi:hypothetical protein
MELVKEIISDDINAKVIVIFGSNPYLRDQVVRSLGTLGNVSVYGTLNEIEGMEKINSLPKVDLLLIGRAYSEEQRIRIKAFVKNNLPNTKVAEPGIDFSVENGGVEKNVKLQLGLVL